jgi:hypothetical protein
MLYVLEERRRFLKFFDSIFRQRSPQLQKNTAKKQKKICRPYPHYFIFQKAFVGCILTIHFWRQKIKIFL